MNPSQSTPVTRRNFLRTLLATPIAYLLVACGLRPGATATPAPAATSAVAPPSALPTIQPSTQAPTQISPTEPTAPTAITPTLPPTPACGDDDDVTPAQTEGPYYTPDTPERTSLLEPGMVGTRMVVTGYVLTTNCQPVAQALIDFWHANDAGEYDNVGYTLRGHQFTDAEGRYTLETIVPGLYPGRTRHFHVKVQAPNQPILTTQLYFPGEAQNAGDGLFSSELLMEVQDVVDGKLGTFNFVLNLN